MDTFLQGSNVPHSKIREHELLSEHEAMLVLDSDSDIPPGQVSTLQGPYNLGLESRLHSKEASTLVCKK